MTIVYIILFFAIYLITLWGTYFFTEHFYPKPFGLFDFYPFICRKCLTTWSMAIAYISVAIIIQSLTFGILGVILSAFNGYAMHVTEKERMEK